MSHSQPTKAVIHNLDRTEPPIECAFNPKEYAIAKRNKWSAPPGQAKGAPMAEYEFGGGEPATMTLQLMFDTFDSGDDVRTKYTDRVWKLMWVDPTLKDKKTQTGRPPKVRFQWGRAFGFAAVITSITQKFVLFREDGTPVRATLDVGFQQIQDDLFYPPQNPSSRGDGGTREWIVKDGDTLASIAYAEYGDPTAWRPIADVNRLSQVRRLRLGTVLEIPSFG